MYLQKFIKIGEFLLAILILKKEENTQHFWYVILYYFKKGKNAPEVQKKICAVYGEGTVTDRMCQKWLVKISHWKMLYNPVDWLKLIVIIIKTLTENNQCYTTWEISDILKISKSMKLLVKMKNRSFILWKKLYGLLANPVLGVLSSEWLRKEQTVICYYC